MNLPHLYFLAVAALLWVSPTVAMVSAQPAFPPVRSQPVDYVPSRMIDPNKLLPIEVNGKWGYADHTGDVVIAPQYEWTDYYYGPFELEEDSDGYTHGRWYARYMSNGYMGWFSFSSSTKTTYNVVKAENYWASGGIGFETDRFFGKYAVMVKQIDDRPKYNLVKITSDKLSEVYFDGALRMVDKIAAVQVEDRCGYYLAHGKPAFPQLFAEARSFYMGVAAVRQFPQDGGAWGFINKRGRFQFLDSSGKIEMLRSYHDGRAAVKVNGKWGFFDRRQKLIVDPIYDQVRDFSDGCAAVCRDDTWGYIDVRGRMIAWALTARGISTTPNAPGRPMRTITTSRPRR